MNHSKNPSCSPQRTTMAHKGNLTSNLQQKFDDILQTQISKKSDWDTIHNIIQTSKHLSAISYYINNDKLCISQYHLYKMVSQKILPVPPRIINLALTSNPDLADSKVYALNVIVAFENHSSLPESLFQLINKSENSSTLVYNVLHKIIHRVDDNDHSDTMIGNELMIQRLLDSSRRNRNNHLGLASIPEENLRVFIHETFLDALYFQDEDGNTLLQQACLNCKSPRIVRLIIEGMMNDVGWWCVLGDNTQKRTPFQLALSSNATYLEISSVLSELLSVIPVQDLPSKFRIQSNDILHASIRTENMYLMFHILKAYPDLLYTWSSEGTLPFHDICRYGSSEVIGEFIVLFEEQVSSQSLIMTKNCPYFVPIQIACVNPASSMDNVYQLIRLISKEKRSMLWSDIIQVNGLLHLVAATSNIAVAKMLLSMCPQALTNNQFEAFGKGPSPLFYACVRGTPAMIEFLFKLGMSDPYHPIYHGGLIDSFSGNELHPIRALCSNHQMTYQSTRTLLHHSKIKMDWMWENRLLHCAAYEGNLEVAMALVDHNPRLLHCKDEDGNTPLHDACAGGDSSLIEYLVARTAQLSCHDGFLMIGTNLCGMLDKNDIDLTPWDFICEMLENLYTEFDIDQESFSGIITAAMMTLVLDAAMNYVGDESKSYPIPVCRTLFESVIDPLQRISLPIYHSAINRVTSITLLETLIVQNYFNCDPLQLDGRGRTALHVAMELQRPDQDWSGIVYHLLHDEVNGSPECASIQDQDGRYPLHVAAESGLCWFGGLEDIVDANRSILECRDDVTNLFPFMLSAASGDDADLDSIFELLRNCPGTLTMQ